MTKKEAQKWLSENEARYLSFGSLGEQFLREATKMITDAVEGFNFDAAINNEEMWLKSIGR